MGSHFFSQPFVELQPRLRKESTAISGQLVDESKTNMDKFIT